MSRMIGEHTMTGRGGRLVEPRSESAELDKAITLLADSYGEREAKAAELIGRAINILQQLREQVSHGFHRNPGLMRRPHRVKAPFTAGDVVGALSMDVHEIRYTHIEDGEQYKHDFHGDVELWAIKRRGLREVLLAHADGKPLWEDF